MSGRLYAESIDFVDDIFTYFGESMIFPTFDVYFKTTRKCYGCLLFAKFTRKQTSKSVIKLVYKITSSDDLVHLSAILKDIIHQLSTDKKITKSW